MSRLLTARGCPEHPPHPCQGGLDQPQGYPRHPKRGSFSFRLCAENFPAILTVFFCQGKYSKYPKNTQVLFWGGGQIFRKWSISKWFIFFQSRNPPHWQKEGLDLSSALKLNSAMSGMFRPWLQEDRACPTSIFRCFFSTIRSSALSQGCRRSPVNCPGLCMGSPPSWHGGVPTGFRHSPPSRAAGAAPQHTHPPLPLQAVDSGDEWVVDQKHEGWVQDGTEAEKSA